MEEKKINNDEIEIDLQRLFRALVSKAWLIAIVAIVCAVATFVGTFFFVTPTYTSSAMFYVNNNSLSLGDASFSISSADISASKSLVKSYIVILNTRETLNDVIDYAGVDYSYGEIKRMISAEAVDSTEIFRITVTSPDPMEAEKIADAIAYILPKRIDSIIEGTSAKIVDSAVMAVSPSAPNYTTNTIIGMLAGLGISALVVIILELMNVSLRTEEDVSRSCSYPVLASVPDMTAPSKAGRYYSYGKNENTFDDPILVGGKVSFAASEAYKLLRTKLQFSFADEGGCRVIGVSGALSGEGKSLSAVNLAYSFSQLGKRVLLIGCDLRRPTLADKIPVRKNPGLSDFLAGQAGTENLIQVCGMLDEEQAFHVIASGRTSPNPVELLSSAKMEKMLEQLRTRYDYIILDLPPVAEVSDALAVAKLTDGMLLVARQNVCDRMALAAAVRQFEFVDAKILGVVFNCVSEAGGAYGYGSYKKYYRGYGKSYADRSENTGKRFDV